MKILRTDSSHKDFIYLVQYLNAELAERDGDDHEFYNQFNKLDNIKNVILCYENETVIACGGVKEIEPFTVEVKRMYVKPVFRGKGLATLVLKELEEWVSELGYRRCVLETGKRQPEAIKLYEKNDYLRIPNYGPYQGVDNSVCFEKIVNQDN